MKESKLMLCYRMIKQLLVECIGVKMNRIQ